MRILVFGLGLNEGGVGSARFFAKKGDIVRVTDLKKVDILKPSLDALSDFPEIKYTLGEHKYDDIDWADLIIKNPAVKPGNPYIDYAFKSGKKVVTDMGIFLQQVKPEQIIGVTGTKGKSTTASLISEVLSQCANVFHFRGGTDLHIGNIILTGNIGKSVLDTLEFITSETLVILEISSFQLEAFDERRVSPKWALITNIYPDHLNYYSSMEEYVNAKKIIAKYQTNDDFLFIRKKDSVVDTEKFLEGVNSQTIRFSEDDIPKNFQSNLLGKHNLENITAALAVAKVFDVSEVEALETLSVFKGVDFRMQLIYDEGGIKIYNDTTATTPDAAIQALETFNTLHSHMSSGNSDSGIILIAGGMNKGLDYSGFAKSISKYVKEVFFLEGDSTDLILSSLRAEPRLPGGQGNNLSIHGPYNNLETLLTDVKKVAKSGDTILFSPAATSFNLFQNEFDRGRKFNEAVEKIFK